MTQDPIVVFGNYVNQAYDALKSDAISVGKLSAYLLDMSPDEYPVNFMTGDEIRQAKQIGYEGMELYKKCISYLQYANSDLREQAMNIGIVSGGNAGLAFYRKGLEPAHKACDKWMKKYSTFRTNTEKKIAHREKKDNIRVIRNSERKTRPTTKKPTSPRHR